MLYSEKLKLFAAAHPCNHRMVDGVQYRYVLEGKENGKTLVFLNGGMDANTLKVLKKKYFLAPLMLWYLKHCNYEKLKTLKASANSF